MALTSDDPIEAGLTGGSTMVCLSIIHAVVIDPKVQQVRPSLDPIGAEELVWWLTKREIEIYVLSRGKPSVVESVAAQLGIRADHAIGGCTSKSKADSDSPNLELSVQHWCREVQ